MLYELFTWYNLELKRYVFKYTRLDPHGERIILEDTSLCNLRDSVNAAGLNWPKQWDKINLEVLKNE